MLFLKIRGLVKICNVTIHKLGHIIYHIIYDTLYIQYISSYPFDVYILFTIENLNTLYKLFEIYIKHFRKFLLFKSRY